MRCCSADILGLKFACIIHYRPKVTIVDLNCIDHFKGVISVRLSVLEIAVIDTPCELHLP